MTVPPEAGMRTLDPAFAEMVTATEEQAWNVARLTTREKVFLSIVADVCNQTLGLPFERHVTAGLTNGVPVSGIRGLLRCVAFEAGYPAALAAFERLAQIEQSLSAVPSAVPPPVSPAAGGIGAGSAATGAPSPPPAVRASWYDVDPMLGEFLTLQSGMLGELTEASTRERSFNAIMVDVLYQTLEETLRTHIGRALRAGAERDDIRAVVRFATQFSVNKAWNAFRALDRHFAEFRTKPAAP